jgi:lipoprotein-anchoring transpeptidase ErfK/SrfK
LKFRERSNRPRMNALCVCDNKHLLRSNGGIVPLRGHRVLIAGVAGQRFWQAVIVAAAGVVCTASRADAAYYYYWQDVDPNYYRPGYRPQLIIQPRRQATRHPGKKEMTEKEAAAKPQGALVIAVSINKQRVKVYDSNGLFAEAPVSTGMQGHPTPMGVFSIIQKHKWHRSNIYSNAPMPYMQRITWSGVAMHAGVLPGYPASHGCIRMPEAFAIKMWNWTRLGARVVVTPGDITPESFSHPLLPSTRAQPAPPAAAQEDNAPLGKKADRGAPDATLQNALDHIELRPSLGHSGAAAADSETALRDKPQTADATGNAPAGRALASLSDPPPTAKDDVTVDLVAKPAREAKSGTGDVSDRAKEGNPLTAEVKADAPSPAEAKPEANSDAKDNSAADDGAAPKGQDRLPDAAKAAAEKAAATKRAGPISVLISGKDSKLYVRQNFAALFESPVTIAPSDRPLGTHVFTVDVDKKDPNVLHWSVVSLPTSAHRLFREDDQHPFMHRKGAHAARVEVKPRPLADTPSEALDRITIPPDVMARITEALTTGSSIIVADQGLNQGETGEGTDFIVSLR